MKYYVISLKPSRSGSKKLMKRHGLNVFPKLFLYRFELVTLL